MQELRVRQTNNNKKTNDAYKDKQVDRQLHIQTERHNERDRQKQTYVWKQTKGRMEKQIDCHIIRK